MQSKGTGTATEMLAFRVKLGDGGQAAHPDVHIPVLSRACGLQYRITYPIIYTQLLCFVPFPTDCVALFAIRHDVQDYLKIALEEPGTIAIHCKVVSCGEGLFNPAVQSGPVLGKVGAP